MEVRQISASWQGSFISSLVSTVTICPRVKSKWKLWVLTDISPTHQSLSDLGPVKERTETDFTKTQAGKVTVQMKQGRAWSLPLQSSGLAVWPAAGEGRLQTPLRFFFLHPPVTNLNIYAHKQAEDFLLTFVRFYPHLLEYPM